MNAGHWDKRAHTRRVDDDAALRLQKAPPCVIERQARQFHACFVDMHGGMHEDSCGCSERWRINCRRTITLLKQLT
jgi:hypothetical protein